MKKLGLIVVAVFALLVISACGSDSKESSVTLDQMVKAYQDEGIEVDTNEKPMYQMVQAQDGVIFYIDKQKVAIYEYKSEKEASKAKEENAEIMKDWTQKGALILESSNDRALQIFNSVE